MLDITLGYHCKVRQFEAAIDHVRNMADVQPCTQFFLSGPQSYKRIYSNEELDQMKENKDGLYIAHGAYTSTPWNLKMPSIENIKKELADADRGGIEGVVIHLGKGANEAYTLDKVINKIARENEGPAEIILETNSVKPSAYSWESARKLSQLFSDIGDYGLSRNFALCVDTAHLYSTGYSMREEDCVSSWFDDLDIGDHSLYMHLNDSHGNFGTGKDIHAALGEGYIWGPPAESEFAGLSRILQIADERKMPLILERHHSKIDHDINKICELLG